MPALNFAAPDGHGDCQLTPGWKKMKVWLLSDSFWEKPTHHDHKSSEVESEIFNIDDYDERTLCTSLIILYTRFSSYSSSWNNCSIASLSWNFIVD